MKVWCVPINFPNPDKEPEQAQTAMKFFQTLKGLTGICPHETGNVLLTFTRKEDARAAKWKLEEFCPVGLALMEGTVSDDGKTLNVNRVVK